MLKIARAILFVALVTGSDVMASEQCIETRGLSSISYWTWDGYGGIVVIKKDEDFVYGHLVIASIICIKARLKGFYDPIARTKGYKNTISDWFLIPDEVDHPEIRDNFKKVDKRIEDITGRSITNREKFKKWWLENKDYALWSNEKNQLVIDENAKKIKKPLFDDTPVLSAWSYWQYEVLGQVRSVRKEKEYSRVIINRPPAGDTEFKIKGDFLNDKVAKLEGFKLALSSLILGTIENILNRTIPEELAEPTYSLTIERLNVLTNQKFDKGEDWIEWWKANKGFFKLSENEERLVVP